MTEQPEEIKRLIDQHHALREAIVDITLAWSNIESSLASCLSGILNDGASGGAYASAIYFAPSNTETRIKIVDAAFDTLAVTSSECDNIMRLWRRVLSRLNHLKGTRNAVAHGTIGTITIRGKGHVRLTAPFFDWRRLAPPIDSGQVPGLSSNDVEKSAASMFEVSNTLIHFQSVAEAIHTGDKTTLQGTLLQIEADLKKAGLPQGARIRRAPGSPRPPSRASRKAERKKRWKKPKSDGA